MNKSGRKSNSGNTSSDDVSKVLLIKYPDKEGDPICVSLVPRALLKKRKRLPPKWTYCDRLPACYRDVPAKKLHWR